MDTPDPLADPYWQQVQAAFDAVVDLPPDARDAALRNACHDDDALMHEVQALLVAHDSGLPLLDHSNAELAASLLTPAHGSGDAPRQIGPYRLVHAIGEGGMGVVYLAERADVGRQVALKVLRDAWLSPARRARFVTEQRALAQLDHPHIARLFDAGALADGTPWFVMEYVDGVSLTAFANAHTATIRDRLALFRDLCAAVQHAHDQAIVHRDLKPSNILVTTDGVVKLLDFGIAKRVVEDARHDAGAEDITQTGLRMMTPAYAAPEQLRGDRIGVFTDVYALGVLLYELLSGRVPFEATGTTAADLERRILEAEPLRLSQSTRSTHPERAALLSRAQWQDLDLICATAMQKEPARRYRSVDALLADIRHFEAGAPLDAHPDGTLYRAQRFVRRRWRGLLVAAVVVLASLGALATYTVRIGRARDAAIREAERRARLQQYLLALFDGGDEAGPADSLRVITLVDRGVQEARLLTQDPAGRGDLLLSLGGVYQKLGRFASADSVLREAALAFAEAPGGGEPATRAVLDLTLGDLRIDQAQYAGADSALQRAWLIAALPDAPPLLRMRVLGTMGRRLEEQGHYDSATVVLERALGSYPTADPDPDARAALLGELANVHFYAGHFDSSDSLNRLALAVRVARLGPAHPTVAEIDVNFGATEFERGRYAEAETWYRKAFAIDSAFFGPNHFRSAANLVMLGRALVPQERFDEALDVLRRALVVQQATFGGAHPRVASILNELGNVALKREAYDSADAYFVRMADVYRAANGDAHFTVAVALSNRATVFNEQKQYARAEAIYRDVVRRFAAAQGAEHVNTGIARIKLGRSLIRQQRWADGAAESEAGHDIVAKQAEPGVSFLQAARKDLAEANRALGRAAIADRWQRAWEANAPKKR